MIVKFVCIFICLLQCADSARILGIFPTPSYSHFILGKVLFEDLARRGHELVVVSPYPQKISQKNYSDIELSGIHKALFDSLEMDMFDYHAMSVFAKANEAHVAGLAIAEYMFQQENVQKLIKSNEHFDLVIIESFVIESVYGFCYRFKAPCFAINTINPSVWSNRLTGNVGLSSYVPDIMTAHSPKMTFCERFHNLVSHIIEEFAFHMGALPKQNQLMQNNFPGAPHLYELMQNTSFVVFNSHPGVTAPVPLLPNMVELGGFHIKENVTLPEDIQKFLDDHDEGVIYFSLGSNIQSKDMPKEQLQIIIEALKKWNQPILWKFEDDELPEKLPNVTFAKWFPQPAVLAHKNVKAFITHMGRLSSLESIYFGVPMIGIPLFAEQHYNAAQMVYSGYGITLEFKKMTPDQLYEALVEITTNPKYAEKAKSLSQTMRSKPQSALEEVVHWVEYVIKFRGAPHLRNAGIDLPWYQFWMVDVILSALFVLVLTGFFICSVLRVCCKSKSGKTKRSKSKKE